MSMSLSGRWWWAGITTTLMLLGVDALARPQETPASGLAAAQRLYYNGEYHRAAAVALELRQANPSDLAAYDIRTSALLFQVKRLIGEEPADKAKALKACTECPELIEAFLKDFAAGRDVARARVTADPADIEGLFFLGKLDLNYVWLHLGPLGRRTGWTEYREARRSLDTVLKARPQHVRARIARAWMEYIVDTKVMFGVRWMLGGGDRKRALATVRDAARASGDYFDGIEAKFGLWEMLAREKRFKESVEVARALVVEFPGNKELARFIEAHAAATR
jgi:hypothetical protein